jgi:hypothetical protein
VALPLAAVDEAPADVAADGRVTPFAAVPVPAPDTPEPALGLSALPFALALTAFPFGLSAFPALAAPGFFAVLAWVAGALAAALVVAVRRAAVPPVVE